MPVKRSDAVGKRRGARGNARVERRTMDANVGHADRKPQRSYGNLDGWSSNLREVEMQVRQFRRTHPDCYRMTSWVT